VHENKLLIVSFKTLKVLFEDFWQLFSTLLNLHSMWTTFIAGGKLSDKVGHR